MLLLAIMIINAAQSVEPKDQIQLPQHKGPSEYHVSVKMDNLQFINAPKTASMLKSALIDNLHHAQQTCVTKRYA